MRHLHVAVYRFSSSDPHRRVHPHPGVPRSAVSGVSGWGWCCLESWPQDGRFPHRSISMIIHWQLFQIFSSRVIPVFIPLDDKKHGQITRNDNKLLIIVVFTSVPGQWAECGEGWSQTGGQHDPARGQQPHGQGRHGYPQPWHGWWFQEEKWGRVYCTLGWCCRWILSLTDCCFPSPPVPQQSKRLSTPAIALRSKSMTSELEEMGKKLAWIQKTDQTQTSSNFLVTFHCPALWERNLFMTWS